MIYNDGIAPRVTLDVKMPCPMLGIAQNALLHTGVASLLTLHRRWLFSLWRPGLYSQPLRFACSPW